MKLYRDLFVNLSAGWFFAIFAGLAGGNVWQAVTAVVLCISCMLLAEQLEEWEE